MQVEQNIAATGPGEHNVAGHDVHKTTVYEAAAPPRPVVTRGLPLDVAGFTGRGRELERLLTAAGPGRVVNIHTVDGMPGVGKTALVTRAAHLLADRFPDGQFFCDLHAHTPGLPAEKPLDVLAVLLTDLGIDPRNLPSSLEGRAHLWRDRLAGKRVLLVLDDAAGHPQIQPLLPGSDGCLTLVTSRRRLIALDGAAPMALAPLTPAEAAELFTSHCHRTPTERSEQDAVAETVRLCGYLPLAIVLLAGRLAHKDPNLWSIAAFTAEFADAQDRLGELDDGDNRAVRTAFLLSYQDLPADQQRLFRRIGLHPGPNLDTHAAAALDNTPLTATRRRLEALYTDHLLDETAPGRYQPHDLLRAYAHTLTTDNDPADDRTQATERLLDYYQHTAQKADQHLTNIPRPDTSTTTAPAAAPGLPDRAAALAWMRTERTNLLACIDTAAHDQAPRVIPLTAAMAAFLLQEGPWPQAATLHQRAATAARHSTDSSGEANALTALGRVRRTMGEYVEAVRLHEQALTLYEGLGDRLGQANALNELGRARHTTDEYVEAVRLHEQALTVFEGLGNRHGQANALNELGRVRYTTGEYVEAVRLQEQALTLYENLGNRHGQANTLWGLGRARQMTGEYVEAVQLHEQALTLYENLGNRHGQANTLGDLGRARQATGDYVEAVQLHEQALTLFQEVGDRQGEAEVLNNTGALWAESTGPQAALIPYRKALELARQVHSPLDEARALEGAARCLARTGDRTTALAELRQAVGIYQRIGAAEAKAAAEYLASLEAEETGGASGVQDSTG